MVTSWKYLGTKEFFKVYCKLIQTAKEKGTIHYEDIAQIMGIRSSGNYMATEVGEMLGIISTIEYILKRPMLSAVVVRKNSGKPGEGFFRLAQQLGKFNHNSHQKDSFWQQELKDVYTTWQ